ncbi:Aste57867_1079 [Aphanomyces stellatus]|uniref:Aste57867_1079 protein n=1 Tax=Aphanomyces stellatus TaxID=120398 RepID=A0A485K4I4_9STRA|nr:hypothetical protein As57867_001078 [Aphanomyces stellatus]VFT78301.1 Aste57867_1079 [Aphanomyces stellatus]
MGCGRSKGLCPSLGRKNVDDDETSQTVHQDELTTPPPKEDVPVPSLASVLLSTHPFEAEYTMASNRGLDDRASGHVASHRKTGHRVAVKCFAKAKMNDADIQALVDQVHMLKDLKHAHIVEFVGLFQSPTHYYMVNELLEGGELLDRLVDMECYSELAIRDAIQRLLSAIQCMHSRNIVHRNLKPENILLQNPSDEASIKICNFEFAHYDVDSQLSGKYSSLPNMAPEILAEAVYGREVDIWSVGVMAYLLLCGHAPYEGATEAEFLAAIQRGQIEFDAPDDVSDLARSFVMSMLVLDPNERPSPETLLQHPWMTGTVPTAPLKSVVQELKRFQLRRKFKAAVKTVQTSGSMRGAALLAQAHTSAAKV